jgi:hypothetical protein
MVGAVLVGNDEEEIGSIIKCQRVGPFSGYLTYHASFAACQTFGMNFIMARN